MITVRHRRLALWRGGQGKRAKWIIAGIVALVAAATSLFIILRIQAEGNAQKCMHVSYLHSLRVMLRLCAEQRGAYPQTIREAFAPDDLEDYCADVVENLTYVAAGKPYNAKANPLLFYDRTDRRYGLRAGWFEFYLWSNRFRNAGEPRPVPDRKAAR